MDRQRLIDVTPRYLPTLPPSWRDGCQSLRRYMAIMTSSAAARPTLALHSVLRVGTTWLRRVRLPFDNLEWYRAANCGHARIQDSRVCAAQGGLIEVRQ